MPVTKDHTCIIPFVRNFKSTEAEKYQLLPGSGGKGEWGVTANGYRVSFWGGDNVLELDSSDGNTLL